MFAELRAITAFVFIVVNTVLACVPLFAMAVLRWLAPTTSRSVWNRRMDQIIDYWTGSNRRLVERLGICRISVDSSAAGSLARDQWYLLTCNHQSWTDILLLQNSLRYALPPIKFFTKRELIWLPALGPAMWVLGFPYVRRPSREAIAANPALRDVDRAEVQRACADFRDNPVAVLNFTEGTRFTREKHDAQGSPYRYLLKPKVGGVELVLNGLRERLDGILDITIHYQGPVPSFWDFLRGRCEAAELVLTYHALPNAVRDGLDDGDRGLLAGWLDQLWQSKDAAIAARREPPAAPSLKPKPTVATEALATAEPLNQHGSH
ncbi:MAG: acetyltransferase [Pseudomonadota bacterium]